MKDFHELLEPLIRETSLIEAIELNDIPNIDLYMDQVTTLMEGKLNSFKRNPEDKILTKTMINNYAKSKLFPPPTKKKYSKNHIMLLVIIYHLKTMLSINDINRLLTPVTDELKVNEHSKTLEIIYDSFVNLQKKNSINSIYDLQKEYELIATNLQITKNENQIKCIVIVLMLSIQSNTAKRLSEKMIDEFF